MPYIDCGELLAVSARMAEENHLSPLLADERRFVLVRCGDVFANPNAA
jgi:hypothetical protein